LLDFIKESSAKNKNKIEKSIKTITYFIDNSDTFELDKIYLTKVSINTISNKYFSAWDYIR
jgi:hypothetical protein